MAKKPTFQMALRDGSFAETPYSPLIFTAGTETYKLALTKNTTGEWIVSDTKSGAKIVTVNGNYKGVPCSSRGFTLSLARQCAVGDLEGLVRRIGSDRFNAVMADPKPF
jgi:hypothetical protein